MKLEIKWSHRKNCWKYRVLPKYFKSNPYGFAYCDEINGHALVETMITEMNGGSIILTCESYSVVDKILILV